MIRIESGSRRADIRVGTADSQLPGPLGTGTWQSQTIPNRRGPRDVYFQEVSENIIENATIVVHGSIEVPCHRASKNELDLLDPTFPLVPPSHLQLVRDRKPDGFLISDTTGRRESISYLGGLNAGADYASTPSYDETRLILITHGALWGNRGLGICPSVLHEIGHVMTHRGELSYAPFPEARRRELEGTRVSRNPGRLEALCNAYMYLLCYASSSPDIRRYGSSSTNNQKDAITRNALRQCRAFRPRFLGAEWRGRFAER